MRVLVRVVMRRREAVKKVGAGYGGRTEDRRPRPRVVARCPSTATMYSQPLPPRGGADDGDDKEKRPPTGSSSHPHHGTPHGLLLHPSRDALRSRVGAIATHASQVTRRRRISLNIAVMATLALYVAVELARYVFAGEHCDALPASAPVAILLVGSVRDVNATHCGAATHVIAPLRRRGHRVSLFFAVDEEEEEDAAAAGRRTEKGAEKAMEGIRRRRARSRALFGEEDAIVAPSSSIPPSSVAAALERVRREHDLDHVEVIPTAPTPTPSACVAAGRLIVDGRARDRAKLRRGVAASRRRRDGPEAPLPVPRAEDRGRRARQARARDRRRLRVGRPRASRRRVRG